MKHRVTIQTRSSEQIQLLDPEPDLLTDEEVNSLLTTCQDAQEYLILILLSRLGMRIGAIQNLQQETGWHTSTRLLL
jgi:integrase